MKLTHPVTSLNRVGAVLARRLTYLNIETIEDLLMYFPFRYEDFREVAAIDSLVGGETVTIKGTIELINNRRSSRRRKMITEAVISDGTEQLRVVWFGQPFIAKTLKVGDEVYLSGKIKDDNFGMQMVSPSYERVKIETSTHTARIVPMYHLTAGLTQKQVRHLVKQAIDHIEELTIIDWLPEEILKKTKLVDLKTAITQIHFPDSDKDRRNAESRLKFDELFIMQLRAEMIRQSIKTAKADSVEFKETEIRKFVDALPFELTKDQKISAWEIFQDIEKSVPMNRLLEGDVGSGKTVVAAMVMYLVVLNNMQSAIMAPTEILAVQHFESLTKLYGSTIRVGLLTRSECKLLNLEFTEKTKKGKREELIEMINTGKIDVLVGTHAILTDKINFKSLALVIVDEQHRFGVEQRKKIRNQSGKKNTTPHFLSMTATPIPRSFALTMYGDLDISIIKQMPAGRKVIKTRLVQPNSRSAAYDFIQDQIKEGRQAFVICPLIEDTKDTEKKSVLQEYKKLSEEIFPNLNVSFLHGKMKARDKDATMNAFAAGEIDILVSTSVVEVGVNIPNASVMMIEGSERFGLAQLHQFRGRVGRSSHQSYCLLFTDSDGMGVNDRLQYFENTSDGFALAEYDLQIRGPGSVYGTHQSGMEQFRLATMKDVDIIKLARDMARDIDFEKYINLKEKVSDWEKEVHLE